MKAATWLAGLVLGCRLNIDTACLAQQCAAHIVEDPDAFLMCKWDCRSCPLSQLEATTNSTRSWPYM